MNSRIVHNVSCLSDLCNQTESNWTLFQARLYLLLQVVFILSLERLRIESVHTQIRNKTIANCSCFAICSDEVECSHAKIRLLSVTRGCWFRSLHKREGGGMRANKLFDGRWTGST